MNEDGDYKEVSSSFTDQNTERSAESPNVCMVAGEVYSRADEGAAIQGADDAISIMDENADAVEGDEGGTDEEGFEEVLEFFVSG